MKKNLKYVVIIYALLIGAMYYVMLPPMNWHSPEFWQFIVLSIGPIAVCIILYGFSKQNIKNIQDFLMKRKQQVEQPNQTNSYKKTTSIASIILIIIICFPLAAGFVTGRFFNASEYASRIKVKQEKFNTIPEVDFKKTPIIDRDSSIRLGDKVMGNMSEWVSQFDVSNEYTQISYKDSVYRATPLVHNGFIKYLKNKKNGIPAYIIVDSTSGKTKLVKLKDLGYQGMKYIPSAYFNKNLKRHLRFKYPTEIFESPSFEIDEKGRPWYICSTFTYKGVGNKKKVNGAIFLDPINGTSKRYQVNKIPKWADRVYPESMVMEELDDYGSLQDGYWNSIIGQNGVVKMSEGYNYLAKDGDIWLYSGITSVNADEANLGFVLVNLRTHETMRIKSPGANELSAMSSAEAEVKNYGYESTFPLLINIKGNPMYLMSLKDNGLIKMYATVSAVDYQKVASVMSDEGLDVLMKKTLNMLGESVDQISKETLKKQSIQVESLQRILYEGDTIYYIQASDGSLFKINFNTKYEERLAFLKPQDTLTISYVDSEGIKTIREIE